MTKRASLTQKESEDMLAQQQGRCACRCGCRDRITLKTCIREHTWAVALGNGAKPDRLLCNPCADRKTNGHKGTTYGSDKHAIAKANRREGDRLVEEGADPENLTQREQKLFHKALKRVSKPVAKIPSRPFPKRPEGHKHQWPTRKVG